MAAVLGDERLHEFIGGSPASAADLRARYEQGRGYAAEATSGLVGWLLGQGAVTITACIHPDHHASARVAARAGLSPTDGMADGERVWRLTASP